MLKRVVHWQQVHWFHGSCVCSSFICILNTICTQEQVRKRRVRLLVPVRARRPGVQEELQEINISAEFIKKGVALFILSVARRGLQ